MSMSTYARRFGILAASGTVYVGAVYLGIQLYGGERKGQQALLGEDGNGQTTTSYVFDPRRTATFQKIAHSYDDEIEKDEFVMGINLLRRALLYFHATGNVLEVGAGTGRNLGLYPSGSVKKITVTDLSDKMLERANEKISKMSISEKARHEVKVADASKLPFPDNSYDTIVDTFGLCSFDDPVAVLKELQRVCKPDGKILLLEHGRTKSYEGLSSYLDKHAERHAKHWGEQSDLQMIFLIFFMLLLILYNSLSLSFGTYIIAGCVWNRDIDSIVEKSGLQIDRLHNFHFGTTYYFVAKPNQKE